MRLRRCGMIRVALVGCGRIAKRHAELLAGGHIRESIETGREVVLRFQPKLCRLGHGGGARP